MNIFLQFFVGMLPLGSGFMDPHIFADPLPDLVSQSLAYPTDPDPKLFFDAFVYILDTS